MLPGAPPPACLLRGLAAKSAHSATVRGFKAMTDFAAARRNMVDGQVRTADVTDLRILAAMSVIAREEFVPAAQAGLAYLDIDVPVGAGRRLLKPMVLAKLIHAADLSGTSRVLDVGCATGYGAAVLAQVAGEVVALEQEPALQAASLLPVGRRARPMTPFSWKAPPKPCRFHCSTSSRTAGGCCACWERGRAPRRRSSAAAMATSGGGRSSTPPPPSFRGL
jgi:protein-L-isoaspartate(D-aspartate) O-methyltransferase (PCMT)